MGARRLEKIIDQVYGVHIPHNRIHRYLLEEGLAGEESRKRRRKPYVRYEREHSMSAGHIDWFGYGNIQLCAILDDASRKVLAAGEFLHADTDRQQHKHCRPNGGGLLEYLTHERADYG